jgi:hypothetical protein
VIIAIIVAIAAVAVVAMVIVVVLMVLDCSPSRGELKYINNNNIIIKSKCT